MILDGLLQFDSGFNLAQAAATYNSTNVLDLGIVNGLPASAAGAGGARDLGIGMADGPALQLLVQVTSTMTSGGAATLQVALQGAPDAGGNAPGAWATWWTSPVYALGSLIAGARLYDMDMPRPPLDQPIPRFLRMQYIIGTAAGTAGTLQAYLMGDRMDQPEQANAVMGGYPAGITVAN